MRALIETGPDMAMILRLFSELAPEGLWLSEIRFSMADGLDLNGGRFNLCMCSADSVVESSGCFYWLYFQTGRIDGDWQQNNELVCFHVTAEWENEKLDHTIRIDGCGRVMIVNAYDLGSGCVGVVVFLVYVFRQDHQCQSRR